MILFVQVSITTWTQYIKCCPTWSSLTGIDFVLSPPDDNKLSSSPGTPNAALATPVPADDGGIVTETVTPGTFDLRIAVLASVGSASDSHRFIPRGEIHSLDRLGLSKLVFRALIEGTLIG